MKIIYFVVPVFVLTGILVLGVLTSMFMSIDTVNDVNHPFVLCKERLPKD